MENAVTALVSRVRDHYTEQFRDFIRTESANSAQGAAEIKIKLNSPSQSFGNLYCIDFVRNDPHQLLELSPPRFLSFDPISGAFGECSLVIKSLRWDDVQVRHDLDHLTSDAIEGWFHKWFDPEDKRTDPSAELSGCIHALAIEPNCLSIDFGTAPPDAFWEILEILERTGATQIAVDASTTAAD